MNSKKILSWAALLGGAAIIIAAFILFKGGLATNILLLNIVVTSLIYGLLFVDILVPWIDLKDKSQMQVGSLGLRWLFTYIYAITAIVIMLVGNLVFYWTLSSQIIVHCSLFFLLILGFVASLSAAGKVQEVFQEQAQNSSGINEMKLAIRSLKDKINETAGLPHSFINHVNLIESELRYLSPSNSEEAYGYEKQFTRIVHEISCAIFDFSINEQSIESNLNKLDKISQNRKACYSN